MAQYESTKICDTVNEIEAGRIVLPAMQRNFVWPEDKIYHLFDSLMRDIPIGTFLFWKIDKNDFNNYVFNKFIKDVDEEKKLQRGEKSTADFSDYIAVLDGQQRITSLYMGSKGIYRTHIKGRPWDRSDSYFNRILCIDLLFIPTGEEEYKFLFVDENEIKKITKYGNDKDDSNTEHFWVTVNEVVDKTFDAADFIDIFDGKYPGKIDSPEKRKVARTMLGTLNRAFNESYNVNYYQAKDKSLPEVVDIFVRVNSGGQKLAASDLMLSVATGQLQETDVHTKMQETMTYINNSAKDSETGFKVDKELILTAGLMFTDADSLSLRNKDNYEAKLMHTLFYEEWDKVEHALADTVKYIEYLGFNGKKLTSKNLVLPIAYYFYHNNLEFNKESGKSKRARRDYIFIRQWLLRSMMNNVFSDATGSTLVRIREVIRCSDKQYFPLDELMKKEIKKPLKIEREQIEDILELEYGDSRIVPLLSELAKNTSCYSYHADHIWPKALLVNKKAIRSKYPSASEDEIKLFRDRCNNIVNLQLLKAIENQEKNDTEFEKWVSNTYPDKNNAYYTENCIPTDVEYGFSHFKEFTDRRKEILKKRIKEAFPETFEKIVKRFNL